MKALLPFAVAASLAAFFRAAPAQANVAASDIKLNGSSQSETAQGNPVLVSYILSDNATLGVSINVYSNVTTRIRTFSVPLSALATNGAGLSRGTNTVLWDGRDDQSNPAGFGSYSVSVTASSSGHAGWTLLTTNPVVTNIARGGYYVFNPRGLAVDNDSNSPTYGRVFVSNAAQGPRPSAVAGDNDAILKFNADGSAADDGAFGRGGYPIYDDNAANLPEKLRTADDDRLYMNDRNSGQVVAFDDGVTTNEIVLNPYNYVANPYFPNFQNGDTWFSLDVTGANTTNGMIWLGAHDPDGAGVWFWDLTTNGVADPSDFSGTQSVAAGPGASLSEDASGGLMVDTNSDVFVGQFVDAADATNNSCLMFTNGLMTESNAVWAVGAGDSSFQDVFDTTIDFRPQPHFVACAMSGPSARGVRILNPANGATLAANLDPTNTYFATSWDNVGNLYAASASLHGWRVWSPPGAGNTSTTVGHASVDGVSLLTILGFAKTNNQVVVSFTGPASKAPSSFSLLTSATVDGTFTPASGSVITNGQLPGAFTAVAPSSSISQFYIIKE